MGEAFFLVVFPIPFVVLTQDEKFPNGSAPRRGDDEEIYPVGQWRPEIIHQIQIKGDQAGGEVFQGNLSYLPESGREDFQGSVIHLIPHREFNGDRSLESRGVIIDGDGPDSETFRGGGG